MVQLTEIDIERLDKILEIVLKEGYASSHNLPPIRTDFVAKLNILDDYKYYFEILKELGIVEFKECIGNNVVIDRIPTKTINFCNQGGFRRIYDEQQKSLSKKKLEDKKFHWDFLNSKLGILSFIVSAISLIIAIIALLNK